MIKNIPTSELAVFLGVSKGFVSNIKAGRKRLPPKDIARVSVRFNVPIDELLKTYEDPNKNHG